jgi:hypothetical protein
VTHEAESAGDRGLEPTDRTALVADLADLIYLHAFAAFKGPRRAGPAIERANRDTARRTAEKLIAHLVERYDLSPKASQATERLPEGDNRR